MEMKFLGHMTKKEGLENLKLTGHIEANRISVNENEWQGSDR